MGGTSLQTGRLNGSGESRENRAGNEFSFSHPCDFDPTSADRRESRHLLKSHICILPNIGNYRKKNPLKKHNCSKTKSPSENIVTAFINHKTPAATTTKKNKNNLFPRQIIVCRRAQSAHLCSCCFQHFFPFPFLPPLHCGIGALFFFLVLLSLFVLGVQTCSDLP